MSVPRGSATATVLRGRCPRCGQGALFQGFLRVCSACPQCGENFTRADTGDGPAVFVILLVGAIAAPLALILELGLHFGPLIAFGITATVALALSLLLLRPLKALLFWLQWRHRAREGRSSP